MISVALLADIHGNAAALEAVIGEPRVRGCDQVVMLGDLVLGGPRPEECLDRMTSLGALGVLGNADLKVLAGDDPEAEWTRTRLTSEGLALLARLPFGHRICVPHTLATSDLLITHSSPRSPFDLLVPESLVPTFGTKPATQEATLRDQFRGVQAGLFVFGHIHYASARAVDGLEIASIGSVGFPFDGDHRAAYAVASWQGESWRLDHYRVNYDWSAVVGEIETSTAPFKARYAAMLRAACWQPRDG